MTYASSTKVPVSKSRDELERILARYGADQYAYGVEANRAVVQFRAENRLVRLVLDLPDRNDRAFTHTPTRRTKRAPSAAEEAWEQACRQRWRALVLMVKAKLEAIESGMAEFESEFLAFIVLPDGSTVAEFIGPQIERAYTTGVMPSALPELESGI